MCSVSVGKIYDFLSQRDDYYYVSDQHIKMKTQDLD